MMQWHQQNTVNFFIIIKNLKYYPSIYVQKCLHVYARVHTHTCMHMYTHICACKHICTCTKACTQINIFQHIYAHLCMCTFLYAYLHAYRLSYICNTHTHMYDI